MLCDLMVAAIVVDTPEAAATYGAISRWSCRSDSKNGGIDAGCILCMTPTNKYDCPSDRLESTEWALRSAELVQAARNRGDKKELHQLGEGWATSSILTG